MTPDPPARFAAAVELAMELPRNRGNSVDRLRETVFTKDMTNTEEITAELARTQDRIENIKHRLRHASMSQSTQTDLEGRLEVLQFDAQLLESELAEK